jgi:hypothetical protein
VRPVRGRLIDSLLSGDRGAWLGFGLLWALTAILVLIHRPAEEASRTRRAGAAFAFALMAVATATSLAGLPLSAALAVPRLRWKAVEAPDLIASASGDSWRKLRGPAVVIPGPEPDLGIPTLDASDRWVLWGVLANKAVPGLAAAEASPAARGAPRLCRVDGAECRAWPVGWPDPARPEPGGELIWARASADAPLRALAYDVETGLYLMRLEGPSGAPVALDGPLFELVGRSGGEPKMEGPSVLFAVRSVIGGRLRAARVAATPDPGHPGSFGFHLHRADVSLRAAPRAFAWVARPLLGITGFTLPVGITLYLLARRRGKLHQVLPWLEASAAFAAGLAAAAPAIVALAGLWGSR